MGLEPPQPRIEAVRIVDMSTSNAWAEFANVFLSTRQAHLEHEKSKSELKSLMPEMPGRQAATVSVPSAPNPVQSNFDPLGNGASHAAL